MNKTVWTYVSRGGPQRTAARGGITFRLDTYRGAHERSTITSYESLLRGASRRASIRLRKLVDRPPLTLGRASALSAGS